ncbi:L7Ae/L30e/S12e/Gadd45 family ribosomal protein [Zongyangia hominis]|uniref:Ribosomal L7Ae/L30e/S12e/Gadd45 family protein n=1 Tax=Zongyangia hominis TaxID=2763677 RepID=A0A926IAP8_9FIRM|nr:ribosomal L7Ae/L30e/S12e/Gadd45 family protein [Zongyangia hominis]MBC8570436.1 ribosomal L7Ae/L30e/S12e/Gadd45 family protein [Zongyangia hominis]
MNEQLLSFLSLIKRAGRLALGFDVVKEAVHTRRAALVLCASDLSQKTYKEVSLICARSQVPLEPLPATMDEIWFVVGKRSGVLAVLDRGMAGRLRQLLVSDEDTKPCV